MLVTGALILAGADAASAAITPSTGAAAGGTTTTVDVPANSGMSFVKTYSGPGAQFVIGVTDNGRLYGWGYNGNGQLGNGNTTNSSTPVQVGATLTGATATAFFSKTWSQVAMTGYTTEALATDGTLWGWGDQAYGRLGNGYNSTSASNLSSPVQITYAGVSSSPTTAPYPPAGVTFTQIEAGWGHMLALGSDNKIYAWGNNNNGEAGTLVGINAIAPGGTATAMFNSGTQQQRDALAGLAPRHRVSDPVEIARAIVYLLADATYSTGTVLVADSGQTVG